MVWSILCRRSLPIQTRISLVGFNGARTTSTDMAHLPISERLARVRAAVQEASDIRAVSLGVAAPQPVRLVAISKTKPIEALREAYDAGQCHFGENYVQELITKVPLLPADVKWHFVGHLQSNKVSALVRGCPSLACLETIDREKRARTVNKAWIAMHGLNRKLRVMVQVNTSGEATKNG